MPVSNVDGLVVRPSGPWIERKYFYLRRYADIFTQGMSKKWGRAGLTYVDLFAGPGKCFIESSGEDRDGSTLISLNYEFSKYIFVENDKTNLAALRERCRKSPKLSQIEFIEGDCNTVIQEVRPQGLTLAFIDPTGIDIHFETLEILTRNRQVDLLLNVQFNMDIVRNFKRYIQSEGSTKMDSFLGGDFDKNQIKVPRDVFVLYKQRLKEKLGYSTVEFKDVTVRNLKNVPMYFLVFASKHSTGLDFWKKITKKDETGQLEFF